MPHPSRTIALMLCIGLAGCSFFSPTPQVRGNRIDAERLQELVIGTSTRNDVAALIGSPTARASFDDNTWLYISELTRPVIGSTQVVDEQAVVIMSFDNRGVLRGIQTKSKDDSVPVSVVDRTTPSPGSEASVMQQLLGNIGRFNPGATGGGGGPSGGAPKPY